MSNPRGNNKESRISNRFKLTISWILHGEFLQIISPMWKRRFERIILSYDYTAQNTWRIAESIEAKSRRRGCNAAIVCPSVSLPLSLSDLMYPFLLSLLLSLSYFYASFFHSFSLFHHIQPIAQIFACLSFSICSRFLSRFVYFVFFLCKIQPPILTPRITIFPFREIHEILCLALTWRSDSVNVKDTSSHALHKNLFLKFLYLFLVVIKLDESYNKC